MVGPASGMSAEALGTVAEPSESVGISFEGLGVGGAGFEHATPAATIKANALAGTFVVVIALQLRWTKRESIWSLH